MIAEFETLQEEVTELKSILKKKDVKIESQNLEIDRLETELRLLRQKLYGPKSERMTAADVAQVNLFNEAEAIVTEEVLSEQVEIAQHTRKKGGRRPLPGNLPRIEEVHDIPEEAKICGCGCMLSRIGEEVTEELDVIPRQYRVIRHIRLKYACRQCEGTESNKGAVQIAPPPVQILPKTIATAGLAASVIVEKFADGLPLYRQAERFSRQGIEISRGTLSNWVVEIGKLCLPLMQIFREDLHASGNINIDETPVQVLNEPGRENTTKSYMWVFRGGMSPPGSIVIFDYRMTRSADDILKEYLTGYSGYVQTDGYIGYEALAKMPVTHAGCWAHVRRKFADVVKVVDKARHGKQRRGGSADEAILKIQRLYAIERQILLLKLTGNAIAEYRRQHALPLLQEFRRWLDDRIDSTPPTGLLGKAMSYMHKQWPRLIVYVDSPYAGIDNNPAENAIRPFALGRKNWLFAGAPSGARASAVLYSLVETAKANGLEPYQYLRFLFERLPHAKTFEDYRKLAPQHLDRKELAAALPQWG